MILFNTVTSDAAFADWNFWFSLFNLLAVFANTYIARKIFKEKKEIVQIKNDIQTIINNNVSAEAVASIVINDEEKIKELSTVIAETLIARKTPQFLYDESSANLSIVIPDSHHSLKFEHK